MKENQILLTIIRAVFPQQYLYCDKDKFSICVGKAERIAPYNKEV
jgi:hypothetical protein